MDDILSNWGPIADFLNVSERTAVRYFKEKGLPVKINKSGHPVIKKTVAEKWKLNTA
jgi:hypothetical protein